MLKLYCNGKKGYCDNPLELCDESCQFYDGSGSEYVKQEPADNQGSGVYCQIRLRAAAARLMYGDNRDIRDYNMLIAFIDDCFQTAKTAPATGAFLDKEESGLLDED